MRQNTDLLSKLYAEAKDRRLVLNKSEFAAILGVTRGWLDKKMKESAVPEDWIEKARELLKSDKALVSLASPDIASLFNDSIWLKAAEKVYGMWLAELSALVRSRDVVDEALRLEGNVQTEYDRLFSKLRKK